MHLSCVKLFGLRSPIIAVFLRPAEPLLGPMVTSILCGRSILIIEDEAIIAIGLAFAIPKNDTPLNAIMTSYFVGRNMLQASKDEGLPFWQDIILIFLQRNAYNPAEFFNIPSNQIVAIGAQLVV